MQGGYSRFLPAIIRAIPAWIRMPISLTSRPRSPTRRKHDMKMIKFLGLLSALLLMADCQRAKEKLMIRFGHFPNITHAQGVIAHALSRQGKGWFEERLGPNVEIQWFTYNAGPSAMEAIFAKSLDVTYVGPGTALNAYLKSNGAAVTLSYAA